MWPEARAVRGQSYGVNDPIFPQDQLCVMLMATWLDFGTKFEQQRRTVEKQENEIRELKATNSVLVAQLADLKTKHENLREAVRKERTGKALKQS